MGRAATFSDSSLTVERAVHLGAGGALRAHRLEALQYAGGVHVVALALREEEGRLPPAERVDAHCRRCQAASDDDDDDDDAAKWGGGGARWEMGGRQRGVVNTATNTRRSLL